MKIPKDLETIRNMLLCDSDDEEDIVLDESDTDEEEYILERKDVIGRAKDLTGILDTCKCLVNDCITESISEETNKYICSVKTNYSRSRDASDTHGAEKNISSFGLDLFVWCLPGKNGLNAMK
ncbi:hypothetical protein NPIL_669671 [Nephila pilipes]|uniref:Uncharacterized protein n=1 Tax=Nephila pilipes TaxID=299642 RepID=A0A8X6PR31_NEPPI|nr:hypothetical protein NPIL_669671 [Nephila pilipes]